jgi:hypothetical protein
MHATRSLLAAAGLALLAGCTHEPTSAARAKGPHATLAPGSVTISGPTRVKPNQTCTWTASVSGGTAPFEYDWLGVTGSTNTQATTSSWSTIGNKVISVDVSDADQTSQNAGLGINVSNTAPDC